VLNPEVESPYVFFRELGLYNVYFFHIFLLHIYPLEKRRKLISNIMDEIGLSSNPLISSIITVWELCFLLKINTDKEMQRENFINLSKRLLGDVGSVKNDDFVNHIYKLVHSRNLENEKEELEIYCESLKSFSPMMFRNRDHDQATPNDASTVNDL
jgi:hypothetical protein